MSWFEMEVPKNWERYEDDEGTYAFFDPKEWKGNFRLSPLNLGKAADDDFLDRHLDNEGVVKKNIGQYLCVHYKRFIKSETEDSIFFCWHFYKDDISFFCSFTANSKSDNTKKLSIELKKVEDVIKSISLL